MGDAVVELVGLAAYGDVWYGDGGCDVGFGDNFCRFGGGC